MAHAIIVPDIFEWGTQDLCGTAGLNEVCLLLAQFWLVFSPIFS